MMLFDYLGSVGAEEFLAGGPAHVGAGAVLDAVQLADDDGGTHAHRDNRERSRAGDQPPLAGQGAACRVEGRYHVRDLQTQQTTHSYYIIILFMIIIDLNLLHNHNHIK